MNVKHLIERVTRVTALAGAMMIGALVMLTAPAQAQNSEGAQINAALAQEAVIGILPEIPAGLGLSPADYVAGNDHSAATRLVRVRIGPDGNVMPSAASQEAHATQCRRQGRETNDAAQVLEFKMIRNTESLDGLTRYQYFVFARLTDPEAEGEGTSIHRQGEGNSTVGQAQTGRDGLMENPDAEGVGEAVREAMENLGVNLGTPSDGCGDIRLVHLFGSVVDDQFGFLAGYQNEAAPDVTYSWDFGDGTVIAQGEQIGRHVYTTKGTYTVTVHVSGENVRDGSASIAVTVKEEEEDEPIQPRDGVWNIKLDSHETQGCAPKIASGVASAMSDMMGKNTRPPSRRRAVLTPWNSRHRRQSSRP